MENKDTSQTPIKPTLLREYEFFGGCIRVKISVKNTSSLAILDAALELESDEKILHFDRCEPEYPEKKGKIQLGNINPNTDRTIAFYLDPLICAKEGTDVNCRVSFKDAFGRPDSVQMEPLKIKVVCPIFRTEQDVNIGRLKELVSGLQFHDSKVYTIPKKVEISELLGTCRDVILLHDVRHIKTFKTTDEKTYEAWYYGKTKVTKKDLVIKCAICKDTESIEVLASGNDPGDITGLLAEIGRNLTKEFERLGKVQPVFNIHIKDSIIQRSNLLSFCNLDGTCGGDVVIEDSVVQRSSIGSGNEAAQKEREEQERLHREEEKRRESERQKAKQEEERIEKEREKLSVSEKKAGISQIKFLAVALVLGVLLLGYWAFAPDSTNSSESSNTTPSPTPQVTTTIPQTPTVTSTKTTTTSSVRLKVVEEVFKGDVTAANKAGLEKFENGYYYVVDWQGDKYVALKGKTNKLVKLILEQRNKENKALAIGETWDIGGGWTVTANSIDAKASPTQVWLTLSKDGVKKDDKVISQGGIYTYVESSIGGESDVPLFVTYIDSVYAGATSDMVKLRYTWAVDTTIVQTPDVISTVSSTSIAAPATDQQTITNSIGMEFVLIPAGEFDMGSPSSEAGRYDDEGPVHRVKIANAFYIGKFEVTQKQWRDVMGTNPSSFKGDNLPIESVSWNDAQDFIKKLNDKEGTNKYRLPSEAEWEYAARAGTTTRYYFGDDESKLGDYEWYNVNSGVETHEVGQKKPNLWGLYDVNGNVWEWVQDIYHNSYNGAPTDGSAWEEGGVSYRVFRGGGWNTPAVYCRPAHRADNAPGTRSSIIGFRLLRVSYPLYSITTFT